MAEQADYDEYTVPCTICGAPAPDLVAMDIPMFLRHYQPMCPACTQREVIRGGVAARQGEPPPPPTPPVPPIRSR